MKKIVVLATALLLSGCAAMFEGPRCQVSAAPQHKVLFAGQVHFANGSAEINAKDKAMLKQIATRAVDENAKVVVYGHASHKTRTNDILQRVMINLRISNERSRNVAKTLVEYGVPVNYISDVPFADSRPVEKEVNKSAEAANRRAEV